ncbi:MAG TPA: DsbA family protein [Candidatus Udaeobacter sp.]|nr:DsbA family protein [Candidatus Udaeobacter sp.]
MRWYQTGWGVALLGLGGLVLFVVLAFGAITVKFWWQIKHGQGSLLQQQVYGGFTALQGGNQSQEKIDRSVLEKGDFPYLGNPNAPITIVVFGDFRCPFTKEVWPTMERLANQYGYKIKLIFRNFPAKSLHPGTDKLSQIAVCAYEQGKYWKTHNYLFAQQDALPVTLSPTDIANLASQNDLDLDKLQKCLTNNQTATKVNRDYADGYRFGVGGTPTFFINGQKTQGVVPWEAWEKLVKEL